jgi:hypothetical protein
MTSRARAFVQLHLRLLETACKDSVEDIRKDPPIMTFTPYNNKW